MDSPVDNNANPSLMPSAPPPPPEVKVRTMRSDIESMATSGGGLPHFQNVAVSGLATDRSITGTVVKKKNPLLTTLVILIILAILGVGGYFAYTMFFGGGSVQAPAASSGQPTPAPSAPAQTSPSATPIQTQPLTPAPVAPTSTPAPTQATFNHASLFKTPADQTLLVAFPAAGAVQSAGDLQTYSQRILAALSSPGTKTSATLTEINVKAADGHDLSVTELLAQAGASVIDPTTLTASFNPDVTFFVYQDKNGAWPGYILALKQSGSASLISSNIKKLESSPSIANFFLTNEGVSTVAGFKDSTVSGSPVRELAFSGSVSAVFTYGWHGDYLILSSSANGFAAAAQRL